MHNCNHYSLSEGERQQKKKKTIICKRVKNSDQTICTNYSSKALSCKTLFYVNVTH
jgi:hypothetical protein